MSKLTVNVLGCMYEIVPKTLGSKDMDGYCDYTSKEIVIRNDNHNKVGDFTALKKKQLRHEIIHAFMAESGLQANWQHIDQFGHDETTVDWFAIQAPKLYKAFEEVGCL